MISRNSWGSKTSAKQRNARECSADAASKQKTLRERERADVFLQFWGEEERWLGCVPTRTGRKDLQIGCFQIFFLMPLDFQLRKTQRYFTVCLWKSMFVAIFLIFPLKATGLLAQGTRVGAARSACPQCWLPWRNFQSGSGCLAQSRARSGNKDLASKCQ